jgi:hypothetical protein
MRPPNRGGKATYGVIARRRVPRSGVKRRSGVRAIKRRGKR